MLAALIVIINNIYYDDAYYDTVSKAGQNIWFLLIIFIACLA